MKEKWELKGKVKSFFAENGRSIVGALSVGALYALVSYLQKGGHDGDDESYDSLLQKREEICLDYQSKTRESDLSRIDRKLKTIPNPRREYSKTLTDDELEKHIESARSIWDLARKAFDKKTKGMPYESYYNDPEKIELDKLHDSFYQSMLEKEYRHAKANPDKFPIHREHGWYLPNDD